MASNAPDIHRKQDVLTRLLRKSARGDWQSFSVFYAMTSPRVFGLILHMTNYSQACEDLLQEVYIKVWKQADNYTPDKARVTTWLTSIARNSTIDWMRSQKSGMDRLTTDQSPEALDLAGGVDPEDETEAIASEESLARCMDLLSDPQRQVIFLAYGQGLTHAEMVNKLGSPLGTVKSWVRRGLESLRNCLRRTGEAP